MEERPPSAPNLLLAGFQKCGSSTLAELLGRHPDITLATGKEPNIFLRSDESSYPGRFRDAFPDAGAAKYRCDASIAYALSDGAALRAAAWCPKDTRIILIARDPVERTLSGYLHLKKRLAERRGLDEIIDALPRDYQEIRSAEIGLALRAMRSGQLNPFRRLHFHDDVLVNALYLSNSLYSLHLDRLNRAFGSSHVKLVLFEDLLSDPGTVLRVISTFLGVSDFPDNAVPEQSQNPTYMPDGLPVAAAIGRSAILLHRVRHALSLAKARKVGPGAFSATLRREIYQRTAPASRRLFEYQGWDFDASPWNHDAQMA